MSVWAISYVALWATVVMLVLMTIVLFRQLGLLHLRLGPGGALALDEGPSLHNDAPAFSATDMLGRFHAVGGAGQATTLVFVAPRCGACEELIPAVRAVHRSLRPHARLLVISRGDDIATADYRRSLKDVPVIAAPDLSTLYGISTTPFVIQVSEGGQVVAKGVVNTLEQLEGLLDSSHVELGPESSEAFDKSGIEALVTHPWVP